MPEEQARFNIEKQEARRDLFNIAGNCIIQHPLTHEPVYIPSIQSVLRKAETTEGDFFKKEPEWVDYEQGFIVERKEVDDIIKKLENNKIQLVLGAPASGKSIILKNVGYELANIGKKVYVVELKKHPLDEIKLFFENIPKIDDGNSIFIVDDAHIYFSDCERLIRNFKGRGKGKLIIGSRGTKEITRGDPTQASEFEYMSKTAIKTNAEDVTEEMIKTFLGSKHSLSDERIKFVSGNLGKFKKDLWYLSWALKAYKPDKDKVEMDEICEKIKDRIINIKAENVFLPLAVFYRYEIPIERKFLEKQLDIRKETIEQLIELSEIEETEEKRRPIMLSLNHSSLAELYFGAYQNYPSLGEEIKEKILSGRDEGDLEYCLFYQYITSTHPKNAVDIIPSIGRDWEDENGGKTLLKKLIEVIKIQDSIKKGIDKEVDIIMVGKCISMIAWRGGEAGLKIIDNIDSQGLSMKIEKEEDIENIRGCIMRIFKAKEDVGLKLIENIDIHHLSLKIDKEKDIEKIERFLLNIGWTSENTAIKLVNNIDIQVLSFKIDKEEDISEILSLLSLIVVGNEEVGLNLVESINLKNLSDKIEKTNDLKKICRYMSLIAKASKTIAAKIVNLLNPKFREELKERMDLVI